MDTSGGMKNLARIYWTYIRSQINLMCFGELDSNICVYDQAWVVYKFE